METGATNPKGVADLYISSPSTRQLLSLSFPKGISMLFPVITMTPRKFDVMHKSRRLGGN